MLSCLFGLLTNWYLLGMAWLTYFLTDFPHFHGNSDAADNEYESKWSVTGHLV